MPSTEKRNWLTNTSSCALSEATHLYTPLSISQLYLPPAGSSSINAHNKLSGSDKPIKGKLLASLKSWPPSLALPSSTSINLTEVHSMGKGRYRYPGQQDRLHTHWHLRLPQVRQVAEAIRSALRGNVTFRQRCCIFVSVSARTAAVLRTNETRR